jgi:hypothetical protein
MVAVAVVGAALGLRLYLREKADPLSRGYRAIADQHAIRVHQLSETIRYNPAEEARIMPQIEHHSAMEQKYGRAARYPFLPVAPDPPEPE